MEWFDPSPYISDSQKITEIFGYWPSFHDAEIHDLSLTVADGEPWVVGSSSPVMEMQIHVFEMTKDVTPDGYFVLNKHTLTRLRFRNVENLQLSNFSFQNCIFGLTFGIESMSYPHGGGPVDGPPPNILTVSLDSSCGLSGSFKCQSAEVISAHPCDEKGNAVVESD
jgi:hypothetical protein